MTMHPAVIIRWTRTAYSSRSIRRSLIGWVTNEKNCWEKSVSDRYCRRKVYRFSINCLPSCKNADSANRSSMKWSARMGPAFRYWSTLRPGWMSRETSCIRGLRFLTSLNARSRRNGSRVNARPWKNWRWASHARKFLKVSSNTLAKNYRKQSAAY